MPTPPDKIHLILDRLTPRAVPEFRRAIDLFEHAGVISPAEAEEWRTRSAGWVEFRFGLDGADEAGPLA